MASAGCVPHHARHGARHRRRPPPYVPPHIVFSRGLRGAAMMLGVMHLLLSTAWFANGYPMVGVASIVMGVAIPGIIMLAEL